MNSLDCPGVRDILPDHLQNALGIREAEEVRAHLETCAECRKEGELLGALLAARPGPPVELEGRIQARIREELGGGSLEAFRKPESSSPSRGRGVLPLFGGRFRVPAMALPAAAVLILGLGTAVLVNREPDTVEQDPLQVVMAEEPLPEAYLWDDGMVAGAPLLEGLTEEELETLLAEMEGEA